MEEWWKLEYLEKREKGKGVREENIFSPVRRQQKMQRREKPWKAESHNVCIALCQESLRFIATDKGNQNKTNFHAH